MRGIITADWHSRNTRPRCRLDEDWMGTQKMIISFIINEMIRRKCDMRIVGDIFHSSRQPEEIVNMIIDELAKVNNGHEIYIMPGNHDLAYHLYENMDKSSYGVLTRTFNELQKEKDFVHIEYDEDSTLLFTHQLTFPNEKEQIVIDGKPVGKCAQDLLDEYPEAQWIFTGDYHKHFHYEKDGRHVINPGCITRQASDFIDYQPVIYYVDTDKEIVETIPLPDTEDMVTDEYIKEEKARNERIESFISTIQNTGEVSLNFIDNLRSKLEGLEKEDQKVLMEVIEEIV